MGTVGTRYLDVTSEEHFVMDALDRAGIRYDVHQIYDLVRALVGEDGRPLVGTAYLQGIEEELDAAKMTLDMFRNSREYDEYNGD